MASGIVGARNRIHVAIRAVSAVLALLAVLSVPLANARAEPPPDGLLVLGADLLRGVEDQLTSLPEQDLPHEIRDATLTVIKREGMFSWPPVPLVPRISGGTSILSAAGLSARARDLNDEERQSVQTALDAAIIDRDVAKAARILSEINGATPDRDAVRQELEKVFDRIMDTGTWSGLPTSHEIAGNSGPQRILLEWNQEARTFRLRIENVLPDDVPGTWFEIEGPVGMTLSSNPFWLDAFVLSSRRSVRHGVDPDQAGSQAAEAPTPGNDAASSGPPTEIVRLEGEIVRANCGQGTVWQNTQTGEIVCRKNGEVPNGPFEFRGQGEPDPDAAVKTERLRQQISALRETLAVTEPGAAPAASRGCEAQGSALASSGSTATVDPTGTIRIECGNIQNFGGRVRVDVSIRPDEFVTSDPNYSGNGTYHKLLIRPAARMVRGGGVTPGGSFVSFDLEVAETRVDLGVLAPGYYRLSVVAWKTELAAAWLLVGVDQRPGALRLVADNSPLAFAPFAVTFDAPQLPGDLPGGRTARYELEVTPIGENGRGHKDTRQIEIEFGLAPGQPIRIEPWMVRPGPNIARLLLHADDTRYVLDTLVLEVGGQKQVRGALHLALDGEIDPENAGLMIFEGGRHSVEFGLGGPLASVRGMATFRVYRLEAPLLAGPDSRQRVPVLPAGAHPGEIVDQRRPESVADLKVWDIAKPLPPGYYAAAIEIDSANQMFLLHFEVLPGDHRAGLVLDGGNRFAVGHDVIARIEYPGATEAPRLDPAIRLHRLGGYVPGCALERERLITPNDASFDAIPGDDGGLSGYRISQLDPGLYVIRLAANSGSRQPIVDEVGFEVVSSAQGTAGDRAEALDNPWPPFGGSLDGAGCAGAAIWKEKIELRLVQLQDGEFHAVDGSPQYGRPYYLEGRLENEARQSSYLATVGAPGGTPEDVRIYRVEDEPNLVRSEMLYFIWDIETPEASDADR